MQFKIHYTRTKRRQKKRNKPIFFIYIFHTFRRETIQASRVGLSSAITKYISLYSERTRYMISSQLKRQYAKMPANAHNAEVVLCPICLSEKPFSKCISLKQCGHKMCKACLLRQLHYDARCCSCRRSIQGASKQLFEKDKRMTVMQIQNSKSGSLGFNYSFKDRHMEVTRIQRESPAYETGLRTGDKIFAINDVPLFTSHCNGQILAEAKKESLIYMTILRLKNDDEEENNSTCKFLCTPSLLGIFKRK